MAPNDINNVEKNQLISGINDEDGLNTSLLMKTIYEIKKGKELNYYEDNILPEILNIIEKDIKNNYINIISNLKKPLKKNGTKIMNDLSNLITYKNMANNNVIKYKSKFFNENINKKEYIDKNILNDFNILKNKFIL